MPAELQNGLPAHGTNGVNGNATELSNPTPAHPAFDSIPDVIQAFGTSLHAPIGLPLILHNPY